MKECIQIDLDGKRTGAVIDRKKKQIWVDKPGKDFHYIVHKKIDDEMYTINYLPSPSSSSECWCGNPECYGCCS